ncbi:hypothetical protein TNIN_201851 [Trichonephila inaurata madagascariensis]|uniref:Uncharacterized protein n=1 Tax=Trichonephila inaurata madagascariensis TaxID=2747483 RepID=A0A8X6YEF4_9ARAC|nr:hypothetical protein TNIN_201851 [Trichonephila inaurata madagascariensis]
MSNWATRCREKYRSVATTMDVSKKSDCSDFGTSETESDSDLESLSAARQCCELNRDAPNPAPQNLYFKDTQD